MESKKPVEGNQPRISFKIGSKSDTKSNTSCESEVIQSSSGEQIFPGESICGLSQASTLPATSQEDIFATQTAESFIANSSPPLQSSQSTSGPVDYEDFIVPHRNRDKNGTTLPSFSHRTLTPKTSTPRKRKPAPPSASTGSTLQRITEELSSSKNAFEGDPKRLRLESNNASHLESPDNLQCQTSYRSSDGDCELIKSPVRAAKTGIETITIDANQKDESPEVKMLGQHSKSRQSLEVLYVRSPARPLLAERKILGNTPIYGDSQLDSMCFQLSQSQDSPTGTQAMINISDDMIVPPMTGGKPITVEDIGDENQGNRRNNVSLLNVAASGIGASSLYKTLPMELEKIKQSITDVPPCITPEFNGNLPRSLKSTTFTTNISVTLTVMYDPLSQKIHSSEVVQSEQVGTGEDVTHQLSRGLSDLSNGVLGDVSDQSKNNSPSSVAGIGPFNLQPVRASIVSTFSSSSGGTTSSGCSGIGLTGLRAPGSSFYPPLAPMRDKKITTYNSDQINVLHKGSLCTTQNTEKVTEVLVRACEIHVTKIVGDDGSFVSPKLSNSRPKKEVAAKGSIDFLPKGRSTPNETIVESTTAPSIPVREKEESSAIQLNVPDLTMSSSPTYTIGNGKSPIDLKSSTETPKTGAKSKFNRNGKSRTKSSKKSTAGGKELDTETSISEAVDSKKTKAGSRNKSQPTQRNSATKASPPSRRMIITSEDSEPHEDSINLPVFARWTDRKYYSGKIVNQAKDGKYNVLFDDGNLKILTEDKVVIAPELRKGLLVFAEVDESESFSSGVIVSMKVVDDVIMYVVELDNSNQCVTVPRVKLYMTEDQVKLLADLDDRRPMSPAPSSTMYKVVPDNILTGKRSRSLKANRPGYSGQGKFHRNNSFSGTRNEVDEDLSSDDESGLEKEQYPRMNPNCKKGTLTESNKQMKEKVFFNPPKSKLFQGMYFLFTCAASSGPVQPCSSSDSSNDMRPKLPFMKDALVNQLTAGGGQILENFNAIDDLAIPLSSVYLISNGACLTSKYILCLCRNIVILNHEWVVYSSLQGKKLGLPTFHLPAGYSIEKQSYVDQHSGGARRKKPLNNKKIILISVRINSTFAQFWTKALEYLGALVTPMASRPDKDMVEGIDMIVAAPSRMHDLKDWAQQLGITAVSTEWMQQCVINWKECTVPTTSESPSY